jgi:hypothetical protein
MAGAKSYIWGDKYCKSAAFSEGGLESINAPSSLNDIVCENSAISNRKGKLTALTMVILAKAGYVLWRRQTARQESGS